MSGIYRKAERMMLKCESKRGAFIPSLITIWRGLEGKATGQQKWSGSKENKGNEENTSSAVTKNSVKLAWSR